jgi:hypothetical protein
VTTTINVAVDAGDISGTNVTIDWGNFFYDTPCHSFGFSYYAPADDFVILQGDTTPPLINGAVAVYLVNVDNPVTVNTFKASLSASDETDGDVTASITVSSDAYTGNEDTLGDYNVQFTASDSANNTTTVTVIFRVVDVTDPLINLSGATNYYLEYGNSWSDPGYSCTDNYDTTCTVVVTGTVNDSALGSYTLNYNATDSSGNTATQKTRTVVVQDTTAAVITLTGSSTVYVEFGQNYTEQGATWTDAYDGTGSAVVSGSVNVGVLGSYTINYNYTDTNGNISTTVSRTVIVRDTTDPVFSGNTTYNSNTGSPLSVSTILSGITATDLYDGDLTSYIVVTTDNYSGNETVPGTYTILLTVTDSEGNSANSTITITVTDNSVPIFSSTEVLYTVEYADNMTQQEIKDHFGV